MKNEQLTTIFSALADPTRRGILETLYRGEASAGELAEPFGISKPAISKHLKVLENAKLIKRKRSAQWHRFEVQPEPFRQVSDWITKYRQFWEGQFDSLEDYLMRNHNGD